MEKKLKKKLLRLFLILAAGFFIIFFLLLTVILMADDEEIEKKIDSITGLNLSSEVLAYKDTVASYAAKYGIEDYVNVLLAIMQVESGGLVDDVMQSSESAGFPPNTLKPVESIEQGVKYFAGLLKKAEEKKCDLDTVIQSYNYGGGFIDYVAKNDKKYTYSLAEAFAKEKSGGKKS